MLCAVTESALFWVRSLHETQIDERNGLMPVCKYYSSFMYEEKNAIYHDVP